MKSDFLRKKFLINLSVILFIFFSDRISKLYVIKLATANYNYELFASSYLNISLIWNEGIAFGLLSVDEMNFYNFLTGIIMVVIIVLLIMIYKSKGFEKYAFLMIFSGALGNVVDRVYYKAVPDFIDFHIGEFHWFIFNVADIFITIGVICLILREFYFINYENNK